LWLAKQIFPDRTEDYSKARHFDASTIELRNGLDSIAVVLADLIGDRRSAAIRGALIGPAVAIGIRRLLHDQEATETEPAAKATIRDVLRSWLALDIEGIERPTDVAVTDLAGCAQVAIATLPTAFRDARCIVQATASHGIKPDIRLRLWYWLDRPTSGAEAKRWLAGSPADPAIFTANQTIYTAAPVFVAGAVDPLPARLAELPGAPCVAVPSAEALAPPPEPPRPAPGPREPVSDKTIDHIIDDAIGRVRGAAKGAGHNAMMAAGFTLGGILHYGRFAEDDAVQWLADARGKPAKRAKDEASIRDAIRAGRARPIELRSRNVRSQKETFSDPPPRPQVVSQTHLRHDAATSSLPAYYPAPTEDRDSAKARQDAAMLAHMAEAGRLAHLRRELHRRRAEAITAAGGDDALTSGEKATITRRLHREIARREGYGNRLPLPPLHMFSGAQGSGKTTEARQFAAASPGLTTWITELTFEKSCEEYTAYLREAGPKPPAMLIRGRERSDPMRPGHFMCDRHKAARRIADAGLSVPDLLCGRCEFNGNCGDHRQRHEADALVEAGQGAVFFLAGNYAFLPSPAPTPDHAILDETLLRLAADVRSIPIEKLAALSVPNIDTTGADTMTTLRAIIEAVTVPIPATPSRLAAGDDRIIPRALASLRHAGINKKSLKYLAKATRKEIDRQTPRINAAMSDSEIENALEGGDRGTLRQLLALISAIKTEIDIPREEATGIWLTELKRGHARVPAIGVARLRKLRGLKKAALTVLDGTGKLDLARRVFGNRLVETNIRFERLAYVISTKGKSYSKQSITAEDRDGNVIRFKEKPAGRLRGDIATIFGRLPAGSSLFASKRVEEILHDSGAVPPDTPSMHFGDLRGKNTQQHDPGALFVGAENLSIADLEATARAFLATDPEPFVSMAKGAEPSDNWPRQNQWPFWATRMRRMRDGTLDPIEVPVHPDPRCQAVLELTRENELIQAVDRLRSIWHRRHLILLNNLCLDLTYDEVHRHKHLVAGGNPIMRALLATGIVPLSPELLHRAHRDIFKTPKAAEHALAIYPQNPGGSLLWDLGVYRFRRLGQTGRDARVILDRTRWPDNAAIIRAIEAFAGPLATFDGVPVRQGETPTSEPVVPMGAGWIAPAPRQPGSGAAPPSIWVHGPPR
jgi:hypothetical protein